MVNTRDCTQSDIQAKDQSKPGGWIFNIQRYSINDGPGIRTTVFFKGCPLKCAWCSNPESQAMSPQLLFYENLCVKCQHCLQVCPAGANSIGPDGGIKVNRDLCKACGACVAGCSSEARVLSGKFMTPEEVFNIIKKDIPFYRNSGGGVTASGGEATYQPVFLNALFKRCRESGLHTTLDTCGLVRWEVLEEILPATSLVLMDIKHMDSRTHKRLTGVENELILENTRKIALSQKPIIIRMPLIPGYNDSRENIRSIADFMRQIELRRIDILPYHKLGISKYKSLGKEYQLNQIELYKEEEINQIKGFLESSGLEVRIV